MSPLTLLLVILCILLLLGGLPPLTGHWHNMGWGISGVGLVLLILVIVLIVRG